MRLDESHARSARRDIDGIKNEHDVVVILICIHFLSFFFSSSGFSFNKYNYSLWLLQHTVGGNRRHRFAFSVVHTRERKERKKKSVFLLSNFLLFNRAELWHESNAQANITDEGHCRLSFAPSTGVISTLTDGARHCGTSFMNQYSTQLSEAGRKGTACLYRHLVIDGHLSRVENSP